MCFGGDSTKTQNSNSSFTLPQWLTDAGQGNLNFAQLLQGRGFTPYDGKQVADFSPDQLRSFGMAGDIAGGLSGYMGQTGSMLNSYANAGPQHINAESIASRMSPYMSKYVGASLTPQLQMQDQQFADQNKSVDRAAAMAGAFGDSGWGQLKGTTTQSQDAARTGLVANAYNTAFNTAIGAGAQDVANSMNAQTTNANLAETALGRKFAGANALYNMGTGSAQLMNQFGGQQTAQGQAGLNAKYNQWLMGQQYPFQTIQMMNQALGAARGVSPYWQDGTQTSSAPDNSGWGMLGSLGGAAMSFLPFMADGGHADEGQYAVVGERGPEVIKLGGDGVVIPNEVLQAASMLRDQKVARGEGQPRQALQEAMQKPVRYMADGGFFGGDGFLSGMGSLDSGNSGAWQNPDGPNATWQNPDNNIIPFQQSAGNDLDARWKSFGATLANPKTWAPLSGGAAQSASPAAAPPAAAAAPASPMPQMMPISLPGGGTSMVPVSPMPASGMKFGIAA